MHVLRWGQSAYETDADMAREGSIARRHGFTFQRHPDVHRTPPELGRADVLVVTSKVRVDATVVAGLRARWVVTTTSGFDHIDVAACHAAGIGVGRCPTARRDAVVSHALGALIALMRRLPVQVGASADGRWVRGDLVALDPRGLHRATVGVLGVGVIGETMCGALAALGARVVRLGRDAALDDILPTLDALTVHCSLTPSSRGLLDATRVARLPAHAVLVNTARGEVLDVEAAWQAVVAGRLRGLACDVFPVEPYPRLAHGRTPGVWFTPHSAGFTHDLGARVGDDLDAALGAIAVGHAPPHVVSAG